MILKFYQKIKKYLKHILSLKLCSVIALVLNAILYYLLLVFKIIDNSDNNNLTLHYNFTFSYIVLKKQNAEHKSTIRLLIS